MDFAGLIPSLTVDSALHRYDNLYRTALPTPNSLRALTSMESLRCPLTPEWRWACRFFLQGLVALPRYHSPRPWFAGDANYEI